MWLLVQSLLSVPDVFRLANRRGKEGMQSKKLLNARYKRRCSRRGRDQVDSGADVGRHLGTDSSRAERSIGRVRIQRSGDHSLLRFASSALALHAYPGAALASLERAMHQMARTRPSLGSSIAREQSTCSISTRSGVDCAGCSSACTPIVQPMKKIRATKAENSTTKEDTDLPRESE